MLGERQRAREEIARVVGAHRERIVAAWIVAQEGGAATAGAVGGEELREDAETLVSCLLEALTSPVPVEGLVARSAPLKSAVTGLSHRWARIGVSATAIARAVFSLKDSCAAILAEETPDLELRLDATELLCRIFDDAALLTFQSYVDGREEIIQRQNRQLLEISTPVVRLWRGVLAVPLIGTLDSGRAQIVMESLLKGIQEHEAAVAIIDITGVPTVDTAVAQHLMQTVAATRLMGADCILSGIRPQIAQMIARLGIDLSEIITRSSLADALTAAMRMVDDLRPAEEARSESALIP
ncbi:rsbT co-antagonist protein RsbR [Thermocatellispora tengchongensis]|uniref:RsbT co-antagonist protein RsbR n=1 Tax=Thermocatellispora tengchongensis TaxID=1073253 RepID=A0A840PJJ8_9ACTN|nr:STAS domain-containing protein [Thermocatellispora tengchongensis]MBB5139076.1 rsbT co-antagonist protein RsbR [Thermocatellispora tengchongensis]